METQTPLARAVGLLTQFTDRLERELHNTAVTVSLYLSSDAAYLIGGSRDNEYQRGVAYGRAIALTELRSIKPFPKAMLAADQSDWTVDQAIEFIIPLITGKLSYTHSITEGLTSRTAEDRIFVSGQQAGYSEAIREVEVELLMQLDRTNRPFTTAAALRSRADDLIAFLASHGASINPTNVTSTTGEPT